MGFKGLSVFILIWFFNGLTWMQGHAQCTVTACPDITICKGETAFLSASGQLIFDYHWSPASSLNQPYGSNPVAHPLATTTYTVTVTTLLDSNLITNGDFENGNTGFSSSYTYNPVSVWNEATYAVNTSPLNVHPNFAPCSDHTSGSGKMMIVNGAGTANTDVWCQTIPVIPNTSYAFSTWLTTVVVNSPAVLQFSINGVILGQPFTAPSTNCTWQQFYEVWNSGTATSAQICIVNQNTATSGNDFALDDISFKRFCLATDSVTVFIQEVPADAGADTAVCIGTPATLSASGGVSYHWNTGHYGNNILVYPATDTMYIVTVTDQLGCQGEDSVRINLLPLPIASAGPDQVICRGDTAILTGTGGANYVWSNGVTSAQNPVIPPVSSIFHLTVTDINQCQNKDSVIVFINPGPAADAGEDTKICIGDSITLNASGGVFYEWSGGETDSWIRVSPESARYYYVTVSDTNGCRNSDSVYVQVNPLPIVGASASEPIICVGTATALTANGAVVYHWTPFEFLSDSNGLAVNASPPETTTFTIKGTDLNGCTDTTRIILEVIDCSLTIPNVFTPNSDGKNDVFNLEYKGLKDYYLRIFNRWGKLVYETGDKTRFWDGTINGTEAATGVYFYILLIDEKEYSGSVSLFR